MTRHLRTYRLVFATAIFATAIALTGIGRADSSEQFELREATIADIQAAYRDGILSPQHLVSRSEEHTSELQSRLHLVCRLLLEKKKKHRNETLTSDNLSAYT